MVGDASGQSDRRRILGAAGLVGALTALSRVLGMVRDAMLTRVLGHGAVHDVFLIAFEIPNLARRVLGEGSLSAFIVPVFTKFKVERGEERAWRFANNALMTMAVFTGLLSLVGWLAARWLFIAFGGAKDILRPTADSAQILALGTGLVQIMIPFLMLLAVAAMMMGLLHSLNHFLAPALGSIILNIGLIGLCLFAFDWEPERIVFALAWAVVISAAVRILVMVPPLVRGGWKFRPVFRPRSEGMLRLYAMMIPATYGLAVAQINISIDKLLARFIDDGAVTSLNYANRLTQLPLAIFAGALATAMLPTLTRHLTMKNTEALHRTMNMCLRLGLLIFMPAMVGLIVLSDPICSVLFEGMRFDHAAALHTAWALNFYALGMLGFGAIRLLTPLYYAREDLRTPIRAAAIGMVVNIVLNLILMRTPLRHGGLALATSIAAMVNTTLLLRWLGIDLHGIVDRPLRRLAVETVALAAAMGLACGLGWFLLGDLFLASGWPVRALILAGLIGGGIGVLLVGAKLLRIPEMDDAVRLLLRRRRPEGS